MKLVTLILAMIAIAISASASFAGAVGFAKLAVPDGDGAPIEIGVWYPTDATPAATLVGLFSQVVARDAGVAGERLPLVVFSHGRGGDFAGHGDTALALAAAGFVVASPTHTGDNYRDESRGTDMAERVRQLGVVFDHMTTRWRPGAIDAARVGAFGFSAGGFTVLALAGGEPDLASIGPHCAAHPRFFDCGVMAEAARAEGAPPRPSSSNFAHRRLRAIVVAAPALGFTFTRAGLRAVDMPVQLWRAADDEVLPQPFYAEAVRAALPRPPQVRVVEHAGHFDFLAPCPKALDEAAPQICRSEPGFDRARFHDAFNGAVVAFFDRTLRRASVAQ